jgi:hypothetical protein
MTEEQLKICTKCKGEFPATSAFYYKDKRSKSGLSSDCIVCRKKLMKASRDANPEKNRERSRIWRKENPERAKANDKARREANPEKIRAEYKAWKEANPEKYKKSKRNSEKANRMKYPERQRERQRDWRKANPEKARAGVKSWRKENSERFKESSRAKYAANPEKFKKKSREWNQKNPEYQKDYMKNKRRTDPKFRMIQLLRNESKRGCRGKLKPASTVKLLGCSYDQIMERFKNQFYPHPETGEMMTLNDIGRRVHIDHIRPLSSFDLSQEEEIRKSCHWSNFQVLWAEDNRAKRDKPYHVGLKEQLSNP